MDWQTLSVALLTSEWLAKSRPGLGLPATVSLGLTFETTIVIFVYRYNQGHHQIKLQ